MNETKDTKSADFQLRDLLNPSHLKRSLSSINSISDISIKLKNLVLLFFKISTLRYGRNYWKKKHDGEMAEYAENPDKTGNPCLHNEMGAAYLKENDLDRAAAAFLKASEADPSCELPDLKLAEIYLRKNDHAAAIAAVKRSKQKKENINAGFLLGKIYKNGNRYEEALEEFAKALNSHSNDSELKEQIYNERIGIYEAQEEYELLSNDLSAIAARRPSDSSLLLSLSLAYKMQGKYEEAEKIFNEASRIMIPAKGITANRSDPNTCPETKAGNRSLNEAETAEGKTKLASKVRAISLCLTNRCNLNCKMCLSHKLPSPEMSGKVKNEIVKTFECLEEIFWAGGEVFLDPDFEEMLDEAARYKVKQSIITNGLLLSEALAEKFVKNDINLSISIDGTTKEVYEGIRRGGSFGSLLAKLDMLDRIRKEINPGFKAHLNVVVMRDNYRQIESFAEFARRYGFSKINYFMVVDDRNGQNIFTGMTDAKILSDIESSLDKAGALCRKYGMEYFCDITKDFLAQNISRLSGDTKIDKTRPKEDEPVKECINNASLKCFAPWRRLNIDFSGDVRPDAHCLCKNIVGNLNSNTMEEVWNGKQMINYRQEILSGNIDKVCTLKKVFNRIPPELLGK